MHSCAASGAGFITAAQLFHPVEMQSCQVPPYSFNKLVLPSIFLSATRSHKPVRASQLPAVAVDHGVELPLSCPPLQRTLRMLSGTEVWSELLAKRSQVSCCAEGGCEPAHDPTLLHAPTHPSAPSCNLVLSCCRGCAHLCELGTLCLG